LKRLGGRRLWGSLDSGNQEDTGGIATVLHANGAFRMLTKARANSLLDERDTVSRLPPLLF